MLERATQLLQRAPTISNAAAFDHVLVSLLVLLARPPPAIRAGAGAVRTTCLGLQVPTHRVLSARDRACGMPPNQHLSEWAV